MEPANDELDSMFQNTTTSLSWIFQQSLLEFIIWYPPNTPSFEYISWIQCKAHQHTWTQCASLHHFKAKLHHYAPFKWIFFPLFSHSLSHLCLFIVLGLAMQMAEALVEFQGPVKGQEGAAPDMSGGLAMGSLWGFRYTSASNLLKSFCSFLYPQSSSPPHARTWLSVPHSFFYFSQWGIEADRACKTQENQSQPITPVSLSLVFDGRCYFKAPGLPELQAWLSSFQSSAGTFPDEIIVLEVLAFKALWKKLKVNGRFRDHSVCK